MTTIVPIRSDFLRRVRSTGTDDQNQPVQRRVAEGGEPCRDVLRRALPGEPIILASYCPFTRPGPYREYGPVFVLANESSSAPDLSSLPLPHGLETDYLADVFVLRAYNRDEEIADAQLASPATAGTILERFFARPEVDFVLARFAAYGCYALRIER